MKPPPFDYHAPRSLGEALDTLAEAGEHGKVLAGGQSLIPMLNMRLAAPAHLVDINRLAELATLDVEPGVSGSARWPGTPRWSGPSRSPPPSRCSARRSGWSPTR
ncbi:FAD binding domain-containing protein [Streptosporangium lutulentum]